MKPVWWLHPDHADDVGDELASRERQTAWEARLLSDDAVRLRKLLDDDERRIASVFETDPLEASEADDCRQP